MSQGDAEQAYAAALEEIERVRAAGETDISFNSDTFRALDRIPEQLLVVEALTDLDLSGTSISGVSLLSGTINGVQNVSALPAINLVKPFLHLKALYLNGTAVNDLTPLSALVGLHTLSLDQSAASDISAIANLANLKNLSLRNSRVRDLRPIGALEKLGTDDRLLFGGLRYDETPATQADAGLARLSEIADDRVRTRQTLAYLNSLPPWPEPYLPAARPDGRPPRPIGGEPEPPQQISAPLRVKDDGERWSEDILGEKQDQPDRDNAREGWDALREV